VGGIINSKELIGIVVERKKYIVAYYSGQVAK